MLEKHLEDVTRELQALRHNPVTEDEFAAWKQHPLTKLFFLELAERYYENLIEEAVVVAHIQPARDSVFNHTNPLEETTVNSILKSGRNQVLEAILGYEPENLERTQND